MIKEAERKTRMKCGVILMRAQPMHLGHLDVIKKASAENEKVLVFVGSANKSGTQRNPLDINDRLYFVRNVVEAEELSNVVVSPLNDWSKEDAYSLAKEWGRFFYYNAVNILGSKIFTFYYNDNAEIAKNWFDDDLKERVSIVNGPKERDISATRVREAILNNESDFLKTVVPRIVWENLEYIKRSLKNCNKEDFIME